jgi:hypothetical protein
MILRPQMASPVTNRCANKYPNLVGQSNRQSGARSLLVETPRRSFKREIPHITTDSGREAKDTVQGSGKDSVIDLTESPIVSQPCASRGVSYLCVLESLDKSLTSLPCAAAETKNLRKGHQRY